MLRFGRRGITLAMERELGKYATVKRDNAPANRPRTAAGCRPRPTVRTAGVRPPRGTAGAAAADNGCTVLGAPGLRHRRGRAWHGEDAGRYRSASPHGRRTGRADTHGRPRQGWLQGLSASRRLCPSQVPAAAGFPPAESGETELGWPVKRGLDDAASESAPARRCRGDATVTRARWLIAYASGLLRSIASATPGELR